MDTYIEMCIYTYKCEICMPPIQPRTRTHMHTLSQPVIVNKGMEMEAGTPQKRKEIVHLH